MCKGYLLEDKQGRSMICILHLFSHVLSRRGRCFILDEVLNCLVSSHKILFESVTTLQTIIALLLDSGKL